MRFSTKTLTLATCSLIAIATQGQTAPPTSGDVTVRLVLPADSSAARPSIAATVVASTNPAIASSSGASLQFVSDGGSFSLHLIRIAGGGMVARTTSTACVSVNGAPASGVQVMLAAGSIVKCSLTGPDGRPGPAPAQQETAQSTPTAGGSAASSQYSQMLVPILNKMASARPGMPLDSATTKQLQSLMQVATGEAEIHNGSFLSQDLAGWIASEKKPSQTQLRKKCVADIFAQAKNPNYNNADSKSCTEITNETYAN